MPHRPALRQRHRDPIVPANMVTKSVIGSLKIYKSFLSASSQSDRKKKAISLANERLMQHKFAESI